MPFEHEPDIRRAWTPPTDFYLDRDLYNQSIEKIFGRSWQFVTDVESVKVPGQVYPYTLLEGCLNEPLLLTRDRNDEIHNLSNVCTHRGNIVVEGAGNMNTLRCRYHGRRFGLDGAFQNMPEFAEVENFPAPCDNLAQVPLARWQNLLFAAIDPAAPFADVFKPMIDRVGWVPLNASKAYPARNREFLIKCHWALYCENYLEGFHVPYVHASLNEELSYGDYGYEKFDYGSLQIGISAGGEHVLDLPADSPDFGKRVAGYYFWFFPNLMFNFYPWGLSINVVRPIGPELTKVNFIPYVWDEIKLGAGAGADLDRVEREDEAIVEMVQRGMHSRFYKRGRYSPKGEQLTHHFHGLLARFLA